MPAKGQGCYQTSDLRRESPPFPSSAPALPAPGRRCCSRRPATPSRCTSAATPAMTLGHQPLGRRHAGAVVRGRGLRARDQPARPALARPVARGIARHAVQRLAGRGASARPQRLRTLRPADHRPSAARCAGAGASSSPSLAGPFSRRAVLSPTKAMSSRAACCRNCTRASTPPAAPSISTATPHADDLDGIVIDCRGLAARDAQPELRGVKGEMIIVETDEIAAVAPGAADPSALAALRHPARRQPLHDRRDLDRERGHRRQRALGAGTARRRLCGASGVRRSAHRRDSARACARPFPTICRASRFDSERIAVNGLYRHGFLLAPALAELTLAYVAARRDRQRGDAMRVTVNGEAARDRRRHASTRCSRELDYEGTHFAIAREFRRAAEKPLGGDAAEERRRDRDHHAAAGRVR